MTRDLRLTRHGQPGKRGGYDVGIMVRLRLSVRPQTREQLLFDVIFTIALGVIIFSLIDLRFFGPGREGLTGTAKVLLGLSVACLAFQSFSPIIALIGVTACAAGYLLADGPEPAVLPVIGLALFNVTASSSQPRAITMGFAVASVGVLGLAVLDRREFRPDFSWLNDAAWVTAAIVFGDAIRARRDYHQETDRKRREEELRHVTEERLQIARELHDVVAHSIALINVQAGVAAYVLDKDPEQAREAFGHIKRVSHETLQELRALVGVLREPREDAPLAPSGSVDNIEPLIQATRDAGMDVDVNIAGTPRHLPGLVDLSAFRVLQEALTNAVKHAAGSRVSVRLDYGDDEVAIDVKNGPRADGAPPAPESGGHGLVGMRERIAAVGGELQAGPETDGGFRVHAVLPLPRMGA